MTWKFLNTGFNSGRWNMMLDERLAHQLNNGVGCSILRVYGWSPHAISIGYHQSEDGFDRQKLASAGIDLVRRITGGRAILHANELTYSVVTSIGERSLRETYRMINEGLRGALALMGIRAVLSEGSVGTVTPASLAVPCFSTSAKHELQVDGRKIVGSAQRRIGSVVLQHGSMLLGPEHRRIAEFLILEDCGETGQQLIEDTLSTHTTDATSVLGRTVSFDEAADCVRRGFAESLHIEFEGELLAIGERLFAA
jgi:lipoate-protein ligase A